MTPLPPDLLAALPRDATPVAEQWWQSLSEVDRTRVGELWDVRLEVRFFNRQADANGCVDEWEAVPSVSGGRFVPHDDNGLAEWGPGYFEHLLQHPELVLAYEPAARVFHLGCTRHAAANACMAAGAVPVDFVCPLGSSSCPLVPLRGSRLTGRCNERP